jgi:hypothetical protein
VNKIVLVIAFIAICSVVKAEDQKLENSGENMSSPITANSKPIERIVKEGRTCYKETATEKMVEACLEGKTYYTPVTEKTRVKVKCPAK